MELEAVLKWDTMTEYDEQVQRQVKRSQLHGCVGYLFEELCCKPYSLKELLPEAFERSKMSISQSIHYIENKDLKSRLWNATEALIERDKKIYGVEIDLFSQEVQSYIDFIELHRINEIWGNDPRIIVKK